MLRREGIVYVFCLVYPSFLLASQGIPNGANREEGRKLRALEQRLFEIIQAEYPEFSESTGLVHSDGRVESYAFQAFERRKNQNLELLNQMEGIDKIRLTRDELRDFKILRNHVQTYVKGYEFREWGSLNPLNFLEGPLKNRDWISKPMTSDPKTYLSRLQAIPQQIEEQILLMKRAIQLNRTNHIITMNGILEVIWSDMFYLYRNQKREDLNISLQNSSSTQLEAWDISMDNIVNALRNMAEFLDLEYFPASRANIGVSSMPGGLDYYQACLDYHLGTRLTPEEIHNLGHSEVKRIEKLMKKVMQRMGFRGEISDFFRYSQKKFRYRKQKRNTLQTYRNVIDDAHDSLWKIFRKIPLTPLKIVTYNNSRIPARGHYTNNVFYINVHYQNGTNTNVLPLAFHEAYPGHHFQECYKRQLSLPLYRQHLVFRRRYAIPFTYPTYAAFTEGWALYAEHLGMEMGFYQTPMETFQKYLSEIFRACRLVVDTGIHAFGWTKERAVAFIRNYTNSPYGEIAREVDRYITWPGQSCAYKVGELKIRDLRDRAETLLGDKFDVKEFHHQILKSGPVSLDILEEVIQDWLVSSRSPVVPNPVLYAHSASAATGTFTCTVAVSILSLLIVSLLGRFL